MPGAFRIAYAAIAILCLCTGPADATSRIKDLANIEGVRQNQLIGYGLVVGLNGTGDTLNNIPFTKQSLQAMLERMGVNIRGANIRTGNVAAVMVTGNLPAFSTQGTRMDVTVSALGDSKNLQGGTLLVTPLLGADGNVYAVAQGSLAIGGFAAEGEASKIVRGVPTVGRIVQRCDHRARDRLCAEPAAERAPRTAQRRFHHGQAHRRRRERLPRQQDRRAGRSVDGAAQRAEGIQGQRRGAADRDRTAAGRARYRREDRHRRTLRHHRHGPRRARRDGGNCAGQSHDHRVRSRVRSVSRTRSRAARPRPSPARGSACRKTANGWRS